ncbi:MAG TPA: outer membrane protein assembly factor BamD, partial [Bryobacteraceae bacterium]
APMSKPLVAWCALWVAGAWVLSACLSGTAHAQPPQTWVLRDGRWEQVSAPTTAPISDPDLDRIESLLQTHQFKAAKKLALLWIRAHNQSPLRDRALYLLGQANYFKGDKLQSFYDFDELLDKYPSSPLFSAALLREYDIAENWLNGERRKFLGIPFIDMQDEGIEILYRIQQRSPGSPLAEKCLLRTGDYYYLRSDFDLASDVYAVFIKTYPRSPEIPHVKLREAFANLAQFRGIRFDATPLIDAREQLLAIERQYPDLAVQENLQPVVQRIDIAFARKILETGDFYDRTHTPLAAVMEYRFVIRAYPDSPEATEARKRLTHEPASALKSKEPGSTGSGLGPATAPSADAR